MHRRNWREAKILAAACNFFIIQNQYNTGNNNYTLKTIEMYKVFINGFEWWADTTNRMLYENVDKYGGFTEFKFLTQNELNQLNNFIKYHYR